MKLKIVFMVLIKFIERMKVNNDFLIKIHTRSVCMGAMVAFHSLPSYTG